MHSIIRRLGRRILPGGCLLLLCILTAFCFPDRVMAATRIHVMTLPSNTNAVILESNGQFGIVDSGEDKDYPNGQNKRYPNRAGTTKGIGFDTEVVNYLSKLGVNTSNLDFYIATHPHSDHIGTADTVINKFHPKRVYLLPYSDSYVTNSAALWDNLYVYEQTQAAAKAAGSRLIQALKPGAASANDGSPTFRLGEFTIQIVNYDQDYVSSHKSDANQFCMGVIATANGHTALLPSDMVNQDGDLDRLLKNYPVLRNIDMMTLNHHGYANSFSDSYLKTLKPQYIIQPGSFQTMPAATVSTINSMRSRLFSTTAYAGVLGSTNAIIVNFNRGAVTSNVDNTYMVNLSSTAARYGYYNGLPYSGVFTWNGRQYITDSLGRIRTGDTFYDKATNKSYTTDGNGTVTASFAGQSVPMYRMYNPNSGEHFYTANAAERDFLRRAGWNYEGIAWYCPSSGTPIYRLYNPNAGDHHYTSNSVERDMLKRAGWRYEGIGWYAASSAAKPVWRVYNPNSGRHHYTLSKGEYDYLVRVGWKGEGIGWYEC